MGQIEGWADPNTPEEMLQKAETVGIKKANLPFLSMLISAILAGLYIGFGAIAANVMTAGAAGVIPFGISKFLSGLVFCVGLILVVVGGAELFTGNALMIIACVRNKISLTSLIRNWAVVYLGNFIGSVMLAILVYVSRIYSFNEGILGKGMLVAGLVKVNYSFIQAFVLGILCNILVCLAVWMTYGSRSVPGKILAILFPITTFIAAGFEHSVANMYIIPMSLLIKYGNPDFAVIAGLDLSTLTWSSFLFNNLLPVTLGNIIGGVLFVGLAYGFTVGSGSRPTV